MAIFGFNIIFDAVDLLLFVVSALNITALARFVTSSYRAYELAVPISTLQNLS